MVRRAGERDSGAWRFVYAGLRAEKARIHLDLGDVSGACRSLARSAALWEPLGRDSQQTEAMGAWLSACTMHVVLLIRSRQAEAGLREIDRVVATMRTLPPGGHVHAIDFINLKATAEVELGQLEAALASYGRSVHGQQLLIEKMRATAGAAGESRALLQDICGVAERVLAATLMNVACVLDDLHRVDESIEIQRAVVASREAHAEESPTIAHLRDLAISLLNLALTYKRSGDLDMAHEMMHESIAVYREMLGDRPAMTVDGLNFPRDVWFEYCDALVIHGSLYADSAEYSRAVELFAEAVPVYEHFVFVEAHLDRVDRLALTYAGQAEVLASAGRRDGSRAKFVRAATIQRRLLPAQPGRAAERLAGLHHKWRLRLGPSASRSDEAVRLLEQQVREHGREDLAGELARAHIARYDDHGPGADGERAVGCAVQLLCRWVEDDIPDSYLTALFEALARKGTLLALRDEHAGAIAWYDRALRLAKRRPIPADRAIGVVVSNRAYALGQQGEWIDSGIGYTQAADLFEPLYAKRPDVEGLSLLIEALNCAAFAWARKRTRRRVRKLAERALRVFDTASAELQASLSTETRERLVYWRKKVPELPSHDDRPVGGFEMMVAAVPGHPVANAVQTLILTFSWSQKQALIRSQWTAFTHPGVLAAFVLLGEAGQRASPDAAAKLREMLRLNLGLVQACKSHGIDETFASAAVRGQFQAAGLFSA